MHPTLGILRKFQSSGTRLIFTDLLEAGYEPHNVKRLYVHGTDKSDTWAKENAKDKDFEFAESYKVMVLQNEEKG
ncbi:MAG: hypothetical protein HZB18_00010 [Chloroflexi bacterium]|nr:hypothetical protein [Chloroflexota bacterium]